MTENEIADSTRDVKPPESWLLTLSREFGRTIRLGKNGVDLVADAACGAANTTRNITKKIITLPRRDHSLSSSEEALFEKLGSKVAECPADDYLSLKNDLEFWNLVKQLHSIRGKVGKEAVAQQEPQQDEPSDSSAEGSESAEAVAEVGPEEEDAPENAVPEESTTPEENATPEEDTTSEESAAPEEPKTAKPSKEG